MDKDICHAFGDVAYPFSEFTKDFVKFLDIKFGKGDRIICIRYAWFDDGIKNMYFLFVGG